MRWMRRSLLTVGLLLAPVLAGAGAGAAVGTTGAGAVPAARSARYVNPISRDFADTFADPSLIRAKDGWWYAYGTSDPLRKGQTRPDLLPIARSHDLVHWSHVADAFTAATLPTWAAPGASLWAPDIRYVDGQYRMYYVVTETTVTPEPNDNAIGMATAPSPAGPWTDSGAPVVGPRRGGQVGDGNFLWTFDPATVTDTDGSQWMFYGSYYGGLFVVPLSADGRRTIGDPTMVAIDNKFEGSYAVHRGGYWYLFASTANCCAGPTTGYSVQVGRSRDLRGPYVDQQGVPLLQSRAGGTPVLNQNGNRWVGSGHNAVATDLAGQDWIVYHAIDRRDPYLDGTSGINQRPMLMDRLDWVHGWPATRAGAGPSAGPQAAPVTDGRWVTTFAHGSAPFARTGRWSTGTDPQSGTMLRAGSAGTLLTRSAVTGPTRVEADLRSAGAAYGLELTRGRSAAVRLRVDPAARRATLTATVARSTRTVTAAIGADVDLAAWHTASLQVTATGVRAQLSNARLGDPVVDLALAARMPHAGHAGAVAAGAGVDVDNLSVVRAATPVTRLVPDRVPSRLDRAASDEFAGPGLAPGWSWVRRDPEATVTGGVLRWPTEAGDLVGAANTASVLLRDPGEGDWAIETKLTIDLGTDTVRNFQQAGLIVYASDDLFTRLGHVAIWDTRQTEFGKEMPYAGRLQYGGTIVGPPAATTWLRISHHRDRVTGEHELRAWTSTNGTDWVKGGVWTLPADASLRVGLVSEGGTGATAQFHWFRLYRG